ncbi:MAG: hypothetical protein Q7U97_17100 [Rhodocyclaceae bacterium]|nr:hypothetical protein [Rhodocyclaceae bacterium]
MPLASTRHPLIVTFALLLSAAPPTTHAGEAYAGIGFPGIFAGYAQPVSEQVTVRADYATLGSHKKNGTEEGIDYRGQLKIGRLGVFADYFPWASSGFRLTGGVTFNQTQITLKSNFSASSNETIGDQPVTVGPGDYFNVRAKFPNVTPFLGIGYGHAANGASGWSFHADVGASFGKPKLTIETNLTDKGVTQANIDKETQELRDGVAKAKLIPQLSIGASYRF